MPRYCPFLCAVFLLCGLLIVGCSSSDPEPVASGRKEKVRMIAMDQEEAGDREAAILTYTQAIEQDPHDVDAYFGRGQVFHNAGDHEKAVDDFNTVLRHEPRHAAAYFSRGQSLQALGNHHQALVSYSLAIAVEPRQARWYFLRGRAYEALAAEAAAQGESGKAADMRQRARANFATARQLDPITDFAALESAP
jgi:tetratricopeptide (TPR) repeat protein